MQKFIKYNKMKMIINYKIAMSVYFFLNVETRS